MWTQPYLGYWKNNYTNNFLPQHAYKYSTHVAKFITKHCMIHKLIQMILNNKMS